MAEEKSSKSSDQALCLDLDKLKVDSEWDQSKLIKSMEVFRLKFLWSGNFEEKCRETSLQKSSKTKSKSCEKTRYEPYQADCLELLQKLNLSRETCKCSLCSPLNSCDAKPPSTRTLNLAHAAAKQKIVIREARLKWHHSQKDKRQVLRAARLKLNQREEAKKPGQAEKTHCSGSEQKQSAGSDRANKQLFGSVQKSELTNFSSLAVRNSPENSQKSLPPLLSFKDYRNRCSINPGSLLSDHPSPVSARSVDKKIKREDCDRDEDCQSSEGSRPVSKKVCLDFRRDVTCSQEARLDDLSVNELASYFEEFVHIPKKMSSMAEMMYT